MLARSARERCVNCPSNGILLADHVAEGNDVRDPEIVELIKEESKFFTTKDDIDLDDYKNKERCKWEAGGSCVRCEGWDEDKW
jgi:hypothetical protein